MLAHTEIPTHDMCDEIELHIYFHTAIVRKTSCTVLAPTLTYTDGVGARCIAMDTAIHAILRP